MDLKYLVSKKHVWKLDLRNLCALILECFENKKILDEFNMSLESFPLLYINELLYFDNKKKEIWLSFV